MGEHEASTFDDRMAVEPDGRDDSAMRQEDESMPSEDVEHRGACHCGAVTFVVKGPISRAMRCTCSICSRIGAIWHGTADAGVVIVSGEGELSEYRFGTMTAKHYFCRHCGIHPLTRPRLNPTMWAVNLRCVDGLDADALPASTFDGANWEAAAEALLTSLRRNSQA